MKDEKYRKLSDHCCYTGKYRGTAHSICNSKYSVPKKIIIVFLIGSNYYYHLIMKKLAEEFKKEFACLGDNAEKYITFTVSIEKEVTKIGKSGNYRQDLWQVCEGLQRAKCKLGHDDK